MLEIAGLLTQSFTLGQGELTVALWFGAGLVVAWQWPALRLQPARSSV